MALTLSDIADAHISLSLRCVQCGHQVVHHARQLLEASGDMRIDQFSKRAKCSKCKRKAIEVIMVITPGTSPEMAAVRGPRWSSSAPFFLIDAWPQNSQYSTLVASQNLMAVQASWEVLQDLEPRAELTLRQGATVMKQRSPLKD